MTTNHKYKIINTIQDDAPFGFINWYTVSFLSPQKMDKTKYLDVLGIKVHNGYSTLELANIDAQMIKDKKNYDVYVAKMGSVHPWDDATKTDSIEYDNKKLNDLEKTRRENIDKIKLMGNQYKNEHQLNNTKKPNNQSDDIRKRLQKKLYKKGLITKQEYEIITDSGKSVKDINEIDISLNNTKKEINNITEDYLDENDPIALQYGCLSVLFN